MSFVKSVDRRDELGVGGWWRREESDLLGHRGQHPTPHSPSWRPHAEGLREKREGGRESSSCLTQVCVLDPAGRAALSGVFKQEGSGRSSVYREGWKRLRSFRLGGREGTALEGAAKRHPGQRIGGKECGAGGTVRSKRPLEERIART